MADTKDTPGVVDDGGLENVEIEFVDEQSGAGQPVEPPLQQPPAEVRGLEPVDLGPSVEIEIERLESELDELRDIHLRKLAEFDNFRKRTERERLEARRHANEELVRELLPVLDNFERALEHSLSADNGAFREGVEMIAKQLWDTLQRQGVEVINPLGQKFTPEFHEAVHRVEDPAIEPGTIATVLAKGYLVNGRLVRPAMVGVVAEPASGGGNGVAVNGSSDE